MRIAPFLVAIALLAGLMATCQEEEEEGVPVRVKVVVSLALFADFARQVGGDRVEVFALVPAGADPHTYEPTPKDAEKVAEADIVFINGWGLEAPLKDLVESNVRQGVSVIPLAGDGPLWESHSAERSANPHRWLNVEGAIGYVQVIRNHLALMDRRKAEYYESNAEAYVAELTDLDQEIERQLSAIPTERRKLVTFHDAFPVFAQRYGFQVAGVVVASPGREPSAKDVAQLVETLRQQDIPAVFTEPQFSARILELAAEDAGAKVCTLYSGALDKEVDTYVKLMRFNANELVRCLAER